MTAKSPNIRYIVAKTHLPQFLRFLKQQMSPFYPFRGGGGCRKGTMSPFFTVFLYRGFPYYRCQKRVYICKSPIKSESESSPAINFTILPANIVWANLNKVISFLVALVDLVPTEHCFLLSSRLSHRTRSRMWRRRSRTRRESRQISKGSSLLVSIHSV